LTEITGGRVGRAHGRDGSFYVDEAQALFAEGSRVRVGGAAHEVLRRAGTDDRPLIRLAGIDDPGALRGEVLLVEGELEDGEYLVSDLVGCEVPGLGRVERVLDAPSCPLLEVGDDALLVPLVGDAVKHVDLERRIIEVDRDFLGY
jgi:16S rRNA processing protein RimM